MSVMFSEPLVGGRELTDEELEAVVGGMTDNDRRMFDNWIKYLKKDGFTLNDAIDWLKATYDKPRQKAYLDEFIAYVTEVW